ncbi:MAG: preprotein translocase subunit YajC [Bdellovibrionota bacterium]
MFSSIAYAQTAGAAGGPGMLETAMPFVFMFVIFYFLMIRPQTKKLQKHQQFLGGLKKGDEVLTTSGIFGKIEGISEKFVTLEVTDGVRLRFAKNFIAGKANEEVKP